MSRIFWPEGRYLVSGGAGFIGSNLVESLLAAGREVRIIDNFITGKRENLADLSGYELIEADIRSLDSCRAACHGIDYVLHQAALSSVPRSIDEPIAANEHNIVGTLNMLMASRENGVKRVNIAASSSAYGDSDVLPKVETMIPQPMSPYAITKLTCEYYAASFWKIFGLPTIILRYFNVFGKKQDPDSAYAAVIPKFTSMMLKGKSPVIFGDGEQSRDFTYIEDVIQANARGVCAGQEAFGQVFNVAYGERITLNRLYRKLQELLECDIEPSYEPFRPGEVLHSLADISKARRLLDYNPQVNVIQGLEKTIDWYKANL